MIRCLLAGLVVFLAAESAWANSPEAWIQDYLARVEGSTVRICPKTARTVVGCPNQHHDPLLRQDTASGTAVQLSACAPVCSVPEGASAVCYTVEGRCEAIGTSVGDCNGLTIQSGQQCYVDECVPPGRYRYGFATPYVCGDGYVGSAFNFVDVTVEAWDSACTRASSPAPQPYTAEVPWKNERLACSGTYNQFGCTTTGAVLPMHLVALTVGLGLTFLRRRRR